MNTVFFLATICMCIVAVWFIAGSANRRHSHALLLTGTAVILLSTGLYLAIGQPDAVNSAHARTTDVTPRSEPNQSGKAGSISSLLPGLEETLESNPDDGSGWLLLARSYAQLGRTEDAEEAYRKAEALGYGDESFADSLDGTTPAAVRGRVSLAPSARSLVDGSDTVFVIARAPAGSPMPLAVVRKAAGELPFEFVLDDSTSMMQGNSLSATDQVVVTVKVSKSGDALACDGT